MRVSFSTPTGSVEKPEAGSTYHAWRRGFNQKGAEHAKSPRNNDRGFSVAARARGLDSSAPAQRGWGLRAAGPIIHPSTAGARTRTRQVGITGHRNGSTGGRKIQQGVFRPPRCGRLPTPKWPNTPFRPVGRLATWAACGSGPGPSDRAVFCGQPRRGLRLGGAYRATDGSRSRRQTEFVGARGRFLLAAAGQRCRETVL